MMLETLNRLLLTSHSCETTMIASGGKGSLSALVTCANMQRTNGPDELSAPYQAYGYQGHRRFAHGGEQEG